ncbi:hypothetical protein [Hymenobacter sp. DG25A]|uniref:hypothetical protein n=1 Tax=Hymenobacter sp. DG25A TaxID=1385663 RepID=UPI0012FB525E|nr:hypothetical protein [Hymenobacter sp. DG25A]
MNYIIDNCSLVNLANGGLLDVCTRLPHKFYVTPLVYHKECTSCKGEVANMIAAGALNLLDFEPGIEDFIDLANQFSIDDGECESILACRENGFALVSDDAAARKCANALLGVANCTGSLGLIKQLTHDELIQCNEAVTAYHVMKECGAFLPRWPAPEIYLCKEESL